MSARRRSSGGDAGLRWRQDASAAGAAPRVPSSLLKTCMILSFTHRFIFVRGRKVAGTSIEMALSTICGQNDVVPAMIPVDERMRQEMNGHCGAYSDTPSLERAYVKLSTESPLEQLHRLHPPRARFSAHTSLAEIREAYGARIDDFHVVVAQRCPYGRVLSALNMAQSFDRYQRGGAMRGDTAAAPRLFDRAHERGRLHQLRNIDLYRGWDAAKTATVIRYEHLQTGLDAFLAKIGHLGPVVAPHAKKGRMANTLDPAAVLRPDQIATINAIFADEFEAFGYRRI